MINNLTRWYIHKSIPVLSIDYDNGIISNKYKTRLSNLWAFSNHNKDEKPKLEIIENDCKGYGEFNHVIKSITPSLIEYFMININDKQPITTN